MKQFSTVTINVTTHFGVIAVVFTIILVLPNHSYALLSQDRIVIGQRKVNDTWILSESIDLLDIKPIEGVYHNVNK